MENSEVQRVSRREFLTYIWGASIALVLAESCGAVTWLTLPREHFTYGDDTDFIRVDANDIPAQEAGPIWVNGKIYLANTERGLLALSPLCTHRGCLVKWVGTNHRFECPCHLAVYAPDGTMVWGDGTRDLDRFVIDVITDHGTSTTPADGSPVAAENVQSVVIKLRHKIMGQSRT